MIMIINNNMPDGENSAKKKRTKKEKPPVDWLFYERRCAAEGYTIICGADEAGRGPLAGRVYAAAVILPPGVVIEGADDSKKLSEKKREQLYSLIIEKAQAYAVACASVAEIEEINILNAAMLAMKRAIEQLGIKPDIALIDGNRLPELDIPAKAIIKGDALSANISCASILAKVTRDRYMLELDKLYPEYGFAKHKGYGTAAHIEALKKYGPCPEHRKSFLGKIQRGELVNSE